MAADPAAELQARLRRDLQPLLRSGDRAGASLLRSLIAAVDDAQAVPREEPGGHHVVHAFADRSAEVPRLSLGPDEVTALLRREVQARETAATEMDAVGQGARAAELRRQAERVRGYLPAV